MLVTCVKQVPDTTQVKTDPVTGTLIREEVPFIIDPFDTPCIRGKPQAQRIVWVPHSSDFNGAS